jgi:hypothetical protein
MDSLYLSISNTKQIDCMKLCMDIQQLITTKLSHTNTDLVLSITLKNIINDENMIPKIT